MACSGAKLDYSCAASAFCTPIREAWRSIYLLSRSCLAHDLVVDMRVQPEPNYAHRLSCDAGSRLVRILAIQSRHYGSHIPTWTKKESCLQHVWSLCLHWLLRWYLLWGSVGPGARLAVVLLDRLHFGPCHDCSRLLCDPAQSW